MSRYPDPAIYDGALDGVPVAEGPQGPQGETGDTGPQGATGPPGPAGAGADEDVIDVTQSPYNVVVDDSTEATAVANRLALIAAEASQYAAYLADGTRLKVKLPLGEIFLSFSRAYNNNSDGKGRILIRTPGAEWYGHGKGLTVIRARSRKDSLGQLTSFTAVDAAASGQQVSRVGNVITLSPGQAANFTNMTGCELVFSPNADGSSPRAQTASNVVESRNIAANTVTITSAAGVTGLANGDYIFIKNRLQLQTGAQMTEFQNSDAGTAALMEVWASPNANGSSPRTGAAPIVRVDTTNRILTLGYGSASQVATWQANDYIFVNVGYACFEQRLASDADSGTVYDMTIRDMTVDGEFYGASSNPLLVSTDPTGDVITQGIMGNTTLGGINSVAYTVSLVDVEVTDWWSGIWFVGGLNAMTSVRCERITCRGGRVQLFMSCDANITGKKILRVSDSDFYSTDTTQGSHNMYINPGVSMQIDGNRFWDRPGAKYGCQHWGTHSYGNDFTIISNNHFAGVGNAWLTSERSVEVFDNNTFTNEGEAIQFRTSCTMTGGMVRKTGASVGVSSYADCQYDAHIVIQGVQFDFRDAAYTAISVDVPSRWVINGNAFTALDPGQGATLPVTVDGVICLAIQSTANDTTQPAAIIFNNNKMTFQIASGAGTVSGVYAFAMVNLDIMDNTFKGYAPSSTGVLRFETSAPGNGRVRICGNNIDSYGGGCVWVTATVTGTPSLEIADNTFTTHLAGRDTITLNYTNTCPTKVRGNRLNSVSEAITVGVNVPAMDITGEDNEIVAGTVITAGGRQGLRMRRALEPTNVTAAASTSLDPNYDTFRLTDTGAINVDNFTLNATASTLLLHDGARITIIFNTGNITLTNAGNIIAAGGARAAGSAASFVYDTTSAKWIEV